jgi:hypothetical protein
MLVSLSCVDVSPVAILPDNHTRRDAMTASASASNTDPIFAAIAKWRPLKDAMDNGHDEVALEAVGDAEIDARLEAFSVIPETPEGLIALISVYAETAQDAYGERMRMLGDENAIPLSSIFAAARKLLGPLAAT